MRHQVEKQRGDFESHIKMMAGQGLPDIAIKQGPIQIYDRRDDGRVLPFPCLIGIIIHKTMDRQEKFPTR